MAFKFIILSAFLAIFLPSNKALYDVPKYLTKCPWTDNDCLTKATRDGIKALCAIGDRTFNVPPMHPSFTWSKGCTIINTKKLYFSFLPGVEVYDMCTINVTKVVGVPDFNACGWLHIPCLSLRGGYIMQGQFLDKMFSGYSYGCVRFMNTSASWYPESKISTVTGGTGKYLDLLNLNVTFDPERTYFDLEHLNQPKHGNDYLNDNQEDMFALMRVGMQKCIAEIWKFYIGGYFARLNLATLYES